MAKAVKSVEKFPFLSKTCMMLLSGSGISTLLMTWMIPLPASKVFIFRAPLTVTV